MNASRDDVPRRLLRALRSAIGFADRKMPKRLRRSLAIMRYFRWAILSSPRALGLDCGPMGGFDKQAIDATYFPDGRWSKLYILNLGYDDGTRASPRAPRLCVADIARFV